MDHFIAIVRANDINAVEAYIDKLDFTNPIIPEVVKTSLLIAMNNNNTSIVKKLCSLVINDTPILIVILHLLSRRVKVNREMLQAFIDGLKQYRYLFNSSPVLLVGIGRLPITVAILYAIHTNNLEQVKRLVLYQHYIIHEAEFLIRAVWDNNLPMVRFLTDGCDKEQIRSVPIKIKRYIRCNPSNANESYQYLANLIAHE